MKRGNRIVIPLSGEPSCVTHRIRFGQEESVFDIVERVELSLEECEAIINAMPGIIQFVIDERSGVNAKPAQDGSSTYQGCKI